MVSTVLAVLGVLIACFIAAALFFQSKSNAYRKTTEATQNIGAIYRGAVAYFEAHGRFPDSVGPTPALRSIGEEARRDPAGTWDHPSWKGLGFAFDEPHRYAYTFAATTGGFTASAHGDLDGDGEYSTFERAGSVNAKGEVFGASGIYIDNERE